MRYSIRWQASVQHAAEIDVDLADIAQWASTHHLVHSLREMEQENVSPDVLLGAMQHHAGLRAALLQQWAIAHATPSTSVRRIDKIETEQER